MKYDILEETIQEKGCTLHRVYYPELGRKGGFIGSIENLSRDGTCKVLDNSKVYGQARVSGNALCL